MVMATATTAVAVRTTAMVMATLSDELGFRLWRTRHVGHVYRQQGAVAAGASVMQTHR